MINEIVLLIPNCWYSYELFYFTLVNQPTTNPYDYAKNWIWIYEKSRNIVGIVKNMCITKKHFNDFLKLRFVQLKRKNFLWNKYLTSKQWCNVKLKIVSCFKYIVFLPYWWIQRVPNLHYCFLAFWLCFGFFCNSSCQWRIQRFFEQILFIKYLKVQKPLLIKLEDCSCSKNQNSTKKERVIPLLHQNCSTNRRQPIKSCVIWKYYKKNSDKH